MTDLKDPKWMYLKAVLFLGIGIISLVLIILETQSLKICLLVGLTIWSFARLYYFMFYVIEKYIDPVFKFSGIVSVIKFIVKKKQ